MSLYFQHIHSHYIEEMAYKMNAEKISLDEPLPEEKERIDSSNQEEEEEEDTTQSTKITDVNLDCLEIVFGFLDMRDLLNLAHTSTRLREVVVMAMNRTRTKTVRLFYDGRTVWIKADKDNIYVDGLKMCLRFLRCFGQVITRLSIIHKRSDVKHRGYLDQYVNKYCADTLVELSVMNAGESTINGFDKPFAQLDKWTVQGKEMCDTVGQINSKWFPKMRHLDLNLPIYGRGIATSIGSISQLQSLSIQWNILGHISQASSSIPSLEVLTIFWDDEYTVYTAWPSVIKSHMKTVKKLCVKSPSTSVFNVYGRCIFPLHLLPIDFIQLEELDVSTVRLIESLDFFKRHPTIEKLTIRYYFDCDGMNENKFRLLKNALPSLTELNVSGRVISIDGSFNSDDWGRFGF